MARITELHIMKNYIDEQRVRSELTLLTEARNVVLEESDVDFKVRLKSSTIRALLKDGDWVFISLNTRYKGVETLAFTAKTMEVTSYEKKDV